MKTNEINETVSGYASMGIRSYTRTELAMMYMPDLAKSTALKNFNIWLKKSENLQEKLIKSGATKFTRRYTPYQVKLIFEEFERP